MKKLILGIALIPALICAALASASAPASDLDIQLRLQAPDILPLLAFDLPLDEQIDQAFDTETPTLLEVASFSWSAPPGIEAAPAEGRLYAAARQHWSTPARSFYKRE